MTPLRIRYALTCAATAMARSGCVFVVESDSHYRYGRLDGSASLDAIHPGVTTRAGESADILDNPVPLPT